MNAGPNGDEPVEPLVRSPVERRRRCSWRDPDARWRDHRIGLVFAGLAVAALLVARSRSPWCSAMAG